MPGFEICSKLENYRLISTLNKNDTLWLAKNCITGSRVVLRKVLSSECAVYRYLHKLSNPALPEILEIIYDDDFSWIIEEYLSLSIFFSKT